MLRRGAWIVLVLACGGAPVVASTPCPECAPGAVVTTRGDELVEAAARALAESRRADATVLLAALASLDEPAAPDRAAQLGLSSLAQEPLPIVAPTWEDPFEQTGDGHFVVQLQRPSADACTAITLDRYDLEARAHHAVTVPIDDVSARLPHLTGLDASVGVEAFDTLLHCGWPHGVVHGHAAQSGIVDTDGEHAMMTFAPHRCGQLEQISADARYAIVTTPREMPNDTCDPRGRLVSVAGGPRFCVADEALLIDLESGAARSLGALQGAVFSDDDRRLLVRSASEVAVIDLASAASRALPADCDGVAAFAPDASALAVACEGRVDVFDLDDASRPIVHVSLTDALLRSMGPVLAVGPSAHGAATALVFFPSEGEVHFAIADAAGVVLHRVGDEELAAAHVVPTVSSHAPSIDAPLVPHVRGPDSRWGPSDPWTGQRLDRGWGVRARFGDDALRIELDGTWQTPSEIWRETVGASGRRHVRVWRLSESIPSPAPQGDDGMPMRWDEGDATMLAIEALPAAIAARTNLRICASDLRVVPVFPWPSEEGLWADAAACAPTPTSRIATPRCLSSL